MLLFSHYPLGAATEFIVLLSVANSFSEEVAKEGRLICC